MSDDPGPAPTGETDPWRPVTTAFVGRVAERLSSLGPPVPAEAVAGLLERTDRPGADLAVPLFRFANGAHLAPVALATRIAADLGPVDGVTRVQAEGPYLNAIVDRATLTSRTLSTALAAPDRYGHAAPRGVRVGVEHTSANPNGPFHIGRIRNALLCDTFARTLRAAGFAVTTEYYVDDLGRQAAMSTWIWGKPVGTWPAEIRATLDGADAAAEKPDRYLGRPYPAVNEYLKTHPEADAEVQAIAHELEEGRPNPAHRELVQRILGGMLASLREVGVGFDRFVWESDLLVDGSVAQVVARLKAAPHAAAEANGAWAIDATGYGLPVETAKIIVTRGDGTTLYATRDVAYHLRKFDEYDRVVDVLGANHLLHGKVLGALLEEIGVPKRPEIVLYQYITAGDGAGMSTRKGTAVYLDDLLDEAVARATEEVHARRTDLPEAAMAAIARSVGAGAVRYHILRVAAEKTVAFRWEEALAFEGKSGPFAQYAYARACSILRKAGTEAPSTFDPARLSTDEEWALVRSISALPGLVVYVARTAHVHALAVYAHELAETFHRFYQEVRVLDDGPSRASRLALVAAFRAALGTTLDLLGLDRLERM